MAIATHGSEKIALGVHGHKRIGIIDCGNNGHQVCAAGQAINADCALRRCWQKRVERQFCAHVGHAQTVKPRSREQCGICVTCINMRKPRRDISAQWHDLHIRPQAL